MTALSISADEHARRVRHHASDSHGWSRRQRGRNAAAGRGDLWYAALRLPADQAFHLRVSYRGK
jgi:hypothetical protein